MQEKKPNKLHDASKTRAAKHSCMSIDCVNSGDIEKEFSVYSEFSSRVSSFLTRWSSGVNLTAV